MGRSHVNLYFHVVNSAGPFECFMSTPVLEMIVDPNNMFTVDMGYIYIHVIGCE